MREILGTGEAMKGRHLTTNEVGRRCGVSAVTVKKWIRQGELRAYRTPGGHYRIVEADFQAFARRWGIPLGHDDQDRRILVIDDDPKVLELVAKWLRRAGRPWKVEGADDGYEGLLKLGVFRPHLLILDLRMPGLNGLQVCQRVRANPAMQGVRILAITAFDAEGVEAEARKAGADGFLAKPFDLVRLEAEVMRLLGAAPRAATRTAKRRRR